MSVEYCIIENIPIYVVSQFNIFPLDVTFKS